jgi:hypothetical protein
MISCCVCLMNQALFRIVEQLLKGGQYATLRS